MSAAARASRSRPSASSAAKSATSRSPRPSPSGSLPTRWTDIGAEGRGRSPEARTPSADAQTGATRRGERLTGTSQGRAAPLALAVALIASPPPLLGGRHRRRQISAGGEPTVTNTATNSHFFDWSARVGFNVRLLRHGCTGTSLPSSAAASPLRAPTTPRRERQHALADRERVARRHIRRHLPGRVPRRHRPLPVQRSAPLLVDAIHLNQPSLPSTRPGRQLHKNPQSRCTSTTTDPLSHPWLAGGDNSAVFVCQRRDRACTNADAHNYTPQCSVVNVSRFASPESEDALVPPHVRLHDPTRRTRSTCVPASADQSIPIRTPLRTSPPARSPPTCTSSPTPRTGAGWTAASANLADSSCGSVILDRGPPSMDAQASDMRPRNGRPGHLQRLRGRRGLRPRRALHLGLRRQHPVQAGHEHHSHLRGPGTYRCS